MRMFIFNRWNWHVEFTLFCEVYLNSWKSCCFLFLDFENLFNIIIFITFKYFKTY